MPPPPLRAHSPCLPHSAPHCQFLFAHSAPLSIFSTFSQIEKSFGVKARCSSPSLPPLVSGPVPSRPPPSLIVNHLFRLFDPFSPTAIRVLPPTVFHVSPPKTIMLAAWGQDLPPHPGFLLGSTRTRLIFFLSAPRVVVLVGLLRDTPSTTSPSESILETAAPLFP